MRQTVLAVVFIALLAVTGYMWLWKWRAAPPSTQTGSGVNERLEQFKHLRDLKPDLGIFSDPVFKSLQKTTPTPTAGPPSLLTSQEFKPGKANPFNPL